MDDTRLEMVIGQVSNYDGDINQRTKSPYGHENGQTDRQKDKHTGR